MLEQDACTSIMRFQFCFRLRLAAALALCMFSVSSPMSAAGPTEADSPVAGVLVEPVRLEFIAERTTYTGRVEATARVEIRARVTGFLGPLQFEEGQEVGKDTLLYLIEKDTYAVAVAEAEAKLASARAALALARVNFERTERLSDSKAISKSDLDSARAVMQQAEALVQAQDAALQRTLLELGYTEIRAPIEGRIGVSNYSAGDLVGPDSGTLALLVSQDPVRVTFPVPQRRLLEVRKAGRTREQVVVHLRLADGTAYAHPGRILYADVQANPSTDTITVRALFPNSERQLFDRQLVGVSIEGKDPVEQLVISQSALALDQQGAYVLVVDDTDTVQRRAIETGEQRRGLLTVTDGLTVGERVIVSGQLKVRPGMKVAPHAADDSASGKTP